jgi:hypothetical protein
MTTRDTRDEEIFMSETHPDTPDRRPHGPIEASFTTLAVSLGTQAIVALGLAENPITGKIEKDREVARFNIDLLRMLREKTKGNLIPAEDKLLTDMLHDLQLKFVQNP